MKHIARRGVGQLTAGFKEANGAWCRGKTVIEAGGAEDSIWVIARPGDGLEGAHQWRSRRRCSELWLI